MNTKFFKLLPVATMLLCGLFSVRAQTPTPQKPTPGGVTNSGNYYSWMVWLRPDGYANGIWNNRITSDMSAATVGNFSSTQTIYNAAGNPAGTLTGTVPATVTAGFNFQPAVNFKTTGYTSAPNQMESENYFRINTGEAFTIFSVMKKANSLNANQDYLLSYGNTGTYAAHGVWWTTTTAANQVDATVNLGWPAGTARALGSAPQGILTIDNPNSVNPIIWYLNGTRTQTTYNEASGTIATQMRIGSCRYDAGGERGFNGLAQEIIVLKRTNGATMGANDLLKIHSYLAIKYGISLGSNTTPSDYINSQGAKVWDANANSGYNMNVFGISRDDLSGLNQVESFNQDFPYITIFKGTLTSLNNNNSTDLDNYNSLMAGSNGLFGATPAPLPVNTTFANGNKITDKVNYRMTTVYKAQVTQSSGNPGGSQTVNIQMISPTARYIVVGDDPNFTLASISSGRIRLYPLVGTVASDVLINQGDYISVLGYQPTPGGASAVDNNFIGWLTGDSYTNGSWVNIFNTGVSSLGTGFGGAQVAPAVSNTGGFNFQPAVVFDKPTNAAAPNQMYSQNLLNMNTTSSMISIFVYKRRTTDNFDGLVGYSGTDNYCANSYRTNGNNVLSHVWGGTAITNGIGTIQSGILAIDNANLPASGGGSLANQGLRVYINGAQTNYATSQWTSYTAANVGSGRVALGGSRNDQPWYGFQGNIMEVIFIKNPNNVTGNGHVGDVDMQKIHSYLAIKYGITLNNSNDYVNSAGNPVWSRLGNTYNYNIFGIGHDDAAGLYQRQSQSINSSALTVYVGTKALTNRQNTGTIPDMQYLMLGADRANPIAQLTGIINDGDIYSNGAISTTTGFNIQSPVYKAQLTGTTSMTVTLETNNHNYSYLMVSTGPDFAPANTTIHSLEIGPAHEVILGDDGGKNYLYIKYIGFSPGPGGVNPGLRLWLRADDAATIKIDPAASNDQRVVAYPDVVTDPDNIPAVLEWNDFVRGQTYSYDVNDQPAGGTPAPTGTIPHRAPVMRYNSPEMNYYPALRFWGIEKMYGSYLSNTQGILPAAGPKQQPAHTAIFMVNNNFSSNPWVYNLMFGSATGAVADPNYYGPGYGEQQRTTGSVTNIVGRFRTSASEAAGTLDLFHPGATSILGYKQTTVGANGNTEFRFNGQVDNASFTWGEFDMRRGSQLGKGYDYDRTIQGVMSEAIIFDRALTTDETRKVESYLAIKYGVTLYPNDTYTHRFNYMFANGVVIWPGENVSGPFVDYYNNIAMVMRDDQARLNNRQAHSTNVGSIVHMGVAGPGADGKTLSFDGTNLGNLGQMNDGEAIAFGCDTLTGLLPNPTKGCGDYAFKFRRTWLVHRQSADPVSVIVGAQNNMGRTIGNDPNVYDYYNGLTAGNAVSLIVAESQEKMNNNEFIAVVPMRYINGEQQCTYTFKNVDTYITFGYAPNRAGCIGEVPTFIDSKLFRWTQWTANTNTTSNAGITLTKGAYPDLGDSVQVIQTQVKYPIGVKSVAGYPRTSNIPQAGSLEVQRSGTAPALNQNVSITVTFNRPVLPSFTISDIDAIGTSREKVQVFGYCHGDPYLPVLSYASPTPSIKISGNTATAVSGIERSGTDARAMLNVKFSGGVDSILILYGTTTGATTTTRLINISPITINSVPLPPPINEDNLSFVKGVNKQLLSSCERALFTFQIQNVNCDDKVVNFSDTLPEHLSWLSMGLDALSDSLNQGYTPVITKFGNRDVLTINNLIVPGGSRDYNTLTLTAKVDIDSLIETGQYSNRAAIKYVQIVNNVNYDRMLQSVDMQTLADSTSFTIIQDQRLEHETFMDSHTPSTYRENAIITFTYRLTNHNAPVEQMFWHFNFNAEFTYVPGSFVAAEEGGVFTGAYLPALVDSTSSQLSVSDAVDGFTGFTQPTGTLILQFKLKAPDVANLQHVLDAFGVPTEDIEPLAISYTVTSMTDDPCVLRTLEGLEGTDLVPYSKGKTAIKSNVNVTSKMK